MSDLMTAEQAHARVALGAAWLDEQCPHWPNEINLDKLAMEDPTFCVLGQTVQCLTGTERGVHDWREGFYRVLEHHFAYDMTKWEWSVAHGFAVAGAMGNHERATQYEMLGIAWRELIRTRLGVTA